MRLSGGSMKTMSHGMWAQLDRQRFLAALEVAELESLGPALGRSNMTTTIVGRDAHRLGCALRAVERDPPGRQQLAALHECRCN